MYSELIIREILDVDKQAKYGLLDTGTEKGITRSAVVSNLKRSLNNGKVMWVTFVADTLHNRSSLLQKGNAAIFARNDLGDYEQLDPAWLETLFGDLDAVRFQMGRILPPNMDNKTPIRTRPGAEGTSAEDSVSMAQGKTVSSGLPTNIAPTPGAPTPTAPAGGKKGKAAAKAAAESTKPPEPPEATMPAAETEIRSFSDFKALSTETQLQLVEAGGMPDALVQEIITYSGDDLRGEVIEAAYIKSVQGE